MSAPEDPLRPGDRAARPRPTPGPSPRSRAPARPSCHATGVAQTGEESDDGALAEVARELYAGPPAEFVAARNARAAEVRRAGDRALATRVKALPKPSAPAWAVGLLAREEP